MQSLPNPDRRRGGRRTDPFDSPWKEAMHSYLRSFTEFFFPAAYGDIDWDAGYESLDTELRQIAGKGRPSALRSDSLFRVRRKSGDRQLVLIHGEMQTSHDAKLAERMFRYNYRSFDAQGLNVASFAILGDAGKKWRPDRYGWSLWGCKMGIRFPVVKLVDWEGREEELLSSRNPFALITHAFLSTRATRTDAERRRIFKLRIVRRLYEQSYSAEDVRKLFRVIDWMMQLEDEQTIIFKTELERLETEKGMPYVTSIERLAKQESLLSLLMFQLAQRFGQLPEWAAQKLNRATPETLESWGRRIFDARSLEEVFA